MIDINVPGYGQLLLEVLVLDYNGTLAIDGLLPIKVKEKIAVLADSLEVHIITSDTFGSVTAECQGLPVQVKVLNTNNHTQEKAAYLNQFGKRMVVAIGNGANDELMLSKSDLGILVLGQEGCARRTLLAAQVIVKDIQDALDLLLKPARLIATLRC